MICVKYRANATTNTNFFILTHEQQIMLIRF